MAHSMTEDWDNPTECSQSEQTQGNRYVTKVEDNLPRYQTQQWTRSFNSNAHRSEGNSWNTSRSNSHRTQPAGLVVYVESRMLGRLIGRGGSKIKELQEESNTKIIIDKSSGNDTTAVTLVGSEEAQQRAKNLIDELLNDEPPPIRSRNEEYEINKKPQIDFGSFDWGKAAQESMEYQKQKWSKLPPINKNFYKEDTVIANMSKQQVAHIRKINNNIEVRYVFKNETDATADLKISNPIETFEQAFRNYPGIMDEIKKQGFQKPSPIQCQAWPLLLSGKDIIGIAQTGTGKTLAFLLPALIHIDGQETPMSERSGPNVIVMAPTRELALQIEKEVAKYSYHGIKAVCVYGGGNRKEQINVVKKGVQIVIATPGRLNDLIQVGHLNTSSVSYLVLDEADRMLDMGFEPQIRKALLDVRPDRQTVMTSATWPEGVRRLAQSYTNNPIQVTVGSLDLAAVHSVTQTIYIIDQEEKLAMLHQFLREMGSEDKVMVFFGKKGTVDDLASDLALSGVDCQSIHGGRDQCDREQALEDVKDGTVRILLATDVASRGIDIEDITHVFNYDFPRDIEEYVHRVGRTGRAGRTGESVTLMTRKDWSHAKELISILEEASQEVPQNLYDMAERYEAWKVRRAEEKDRERQDSRGYSGNRFERKRFGNNY